MKPITKKLLLGLSAVAAGAVTLVYAFDPLNPEQHRLCSGLPQHASWDVSEGNKSVVWSYLGDLLNVVVPEGVQIGGALTPRTTEGKTLCTFTCDYGYKLNPSNQTCVEDPDVNPCPEGYYWNNTSKKCEKNSNSYPAAIVDGYNYAYELGIESRSIDEADLYGSITKQELAKIISIFSEELSRAKDKNAECNFTDRTDADGDYVDYIISACQYGLMGENNTAFDPYGTVNYAIFGTTLSRALWGDLYDEGNPDPYYVNHFAALKMLGVINNPDPDSPVLRGYAYSMIYKAMYNEAGNNEVVLQNNISGTRTFKRNEIMRGTVFDGTYTTVKSSKINGWAVIRSEGQGYFSGGDANFYLSINGEEVGMIPSRNSVGFSSGFTTINLNPGQTVTVKVEVEIDGGRVSAGTYNYGLALLDLSSEGGEIETTDFVPIEVLSNTTKIDITSNKDTDVVLGDNRITLGKFLLTPSDKSLAYAYIDTLSIDFDSGVNTNFENLVISINNGIDDNMILECEDKGTSTIGTHWIKCDDLNYYVPAEGAELKVELNNPELGVYRTTVSGINEYGDFYSTIRLAVNPLIELELAEDDGETTSYNILSEGFGTTGDSISHIKLYTGDYNTIDEANNATPVIEVNDEIDLTNPDANIYFDNLAEAVIINTFRYDSNGKTFIINKSWYPDYFEKSLNNLTIHAKSNS